ncbi:MAG: Ig-like domain-containing protein [Rhodococcus sp. (in: high G+C Gram-positive bacteria)]|uniref:Ig-like domain-containing protein n=1 Tax=Rhodococcus sp. TaxID=1831 RepID=UPI003BB167D5
MSPSSVRRVAALASAGTLAVLLSCPVASAEEVEVGFGLACRVRSIIDVDEALGSSVTIDAPTHVRPGQTFTYRIQPTALSYPDSSHGATTQNISRVKYDFAVPANATFVRAAVVPGTSFNLENVPPNVLRVGEDGVVDDVAGTVLRLSGNNEVIGNSPTSDGDSEGGIRVPKTQLDLDGSPNAAGDTWFRLPAVDVTMVAGPSGVITPSIRTAGDAGRVDDDANYNTTLTRATFFGTNQWGPTRCSPRDTMTGPLNEGAGPLATITVSDAPDVATTVRVEAPADAEDGTVVQLSATVTPTAEGGPVAVGGTVQFRDGGTEIGAPVEVVDGRAALDHTITGGGTHSITATYSGATGFAGSTSDPATVSVPEPADYRVWWIAGGVVAAVAVVLVLLALRRSRRRTDTDHAS